MNQQLATNALQRKRRTKAQIEVERYAFHEAGHAVMAWTVGLPVEGVYMIREGRTAGYVSTVRTVFTQIIEMVQEDEYPLLSLWKRDALAALAYDYIAVKLAGPVSQIRVEPQSAPRLRVWLTTGAADRHEANQLADYLFTGDGDQFVRTAEKDVRRRLSEGHLWNAVQTVARRLEPGAIIEGDELHHLLAVDAGLGPMPTVNWNPLDDRSAA